MHVIFRRLATMIAALVMSAALTVPTLADDLSGTYRIATATGKHMIVTLIWSINNTITGYYVGNGVAGRLTGQVKPDFSVTYTWEERQGDAGQDTTKSGWGNMTFNDSGSAMKTAWGYAGQQRAVGFWNATRIDP
jgi:hypothetical protein